MHTPPFVPSAVAATIPPPLVPDPASMSASDDADDKGHDASRPIGETPSINTTGPHHGV